MKGHPHQTHPGARSSVSRLLTYEIHVEPSLLRQRIREIDEEFARQNKRLAAMTRRWSKKLKKLN